MVELTPETIALGLSGYVILLFSLSVHESAHAWMAHRLGDDTAKDDGRISLNPVVHMDPIGTVLMPLISFFNTGQPFFGWAKPTPYEPRNFHRHVTVGRGHILVAGAGPLSNLALSLLFTAILWLDAQLGVALPAPLRYTLFLGVDLNVVLALFNLVPVPPLDGSKVVSWGLPRHLGEAYDRFVQPLGMVLLIVVVVTFGRFIRPITDAVNDVLYRVVS